MKLDLLKIIKDAECIKSMGQGNHILDRTKSGERPVSVFTSVQDDKGFWKPVPAGMTDEDHYEMIFFCGQTDSLDLDLCKKFGFPNDLKSYPHVKPRQKVCIKCLAKYLTHLGY